MFRILIFLIFTLVAGSLASPAAHAQSPGFRPEEIRMRMEQSVVRQRLTIQRIAESIARQKSGLTRQRGATMAADFFRPYVPRSRSGPAPEPTPATDCSTLEPEEIDSLIDSAAADSSVDPELIRAVMRQESAFQPCAVSPKGAAGLMQLMPATSADLGVKDVFNPEANVLGGARLLKQLMNRYDGDLSLALSAYNAGPRRVDAAGGIPGIPETKNYVSRILEKLASSTPAKQGLGTKPPGFQYDLDKAPSTSFWLIGNEGGK